MDTPEDINGMTDEELIEAVAVKVMGWAVSATCDHCYGTGTRAIENRDNRDLRPCVWCDGTKKRKPYIVESPKFNPLSDWNHTWEIIEAMKRRKCCILLEWQKVVDWNVAILPNHVMSGLLGKNDGKVPEEAYMHEGEGGLQKTICLAALAALQAISLSKP